jgi:hypothetical protein
MDESLVEGAVDLKDKERRVYHRNCRVTVSLERVSIILGGGVALGVGGRFPAHLT